MKNFNISTRIYLGFGAVLVLVLLVAGVGFIGLQSAEGTFSQYRQLARQTNADGRVQANMLMTRIFAKNFVIDANRENIEGVKRRAEATLKLIRESRDLTGKDTGRQVLIDDLEENLQRYVTKFEEVTKLQARRNELVARKLNSLGPETERALTQIMTSAVADNDQKAANEASSTLRSLMLGRLYANRFLIENDEASRSRAIREFRDAEFNYLKMAAELENPERLALADKVFKNQSAYLDAFDEVHNVIVERNNVIKFELDRIGPAVASRIERLKLAIKEEQDRLGPEAQASLTQSVVISSVVSVLAILLGILAAGYIGAGITRPIRQLTDTAAAMGEGDLKREIDVSRTDEVGRLAKAFDAMRGNIVNQVTKLEQEIAERNRAEKELSETHENLERIVEERTQELAQARDEAEQATKAKAEFLATMSHEIRTPMNGVIGMIDLLKQSKMSRDQLEMVETVRTSAYALLTIINDILDFSKIEAGKLDLESVPMSISDVVEGVTETLAPNAQNKGLRLHSYVDPAIPLAVSGDAVRIRQILFNLAGNAVKFTEDGAVTIRADLIPGGGDGNAKIQFQIIDTGIGISKEAQSSLFEAFTQAESSTTRRFGGTGLGLTICQRIVDIMGGSIRVESELGKGSTFSVEITLPVPDDHQIKSETYDLSGLKVLLAVQDTFLRESLMKYLLAYGAQATVQPEFELVESQVSSAADSGIPFDVLFMENIGFRARTDTIRAIQSRANASGTTFVLQVDRRQAEREDLENTVYAVLNPIKRAAFVRAIAAAVGRTSPDLEFDDEEELATGEIEPPTVDEAEAMGQLILMAEDNVTNQKVILRQLNSLGYAALIADDGEQALKALEERSFAVLLTDCHMPNMDGFDLTRNIREQEQTDGKRLPIVAITASALSEEIEECYEAGMDDFLSKPVEIAKLHGALKKWMPAVDPLARPQPATQPKETKGNGRGNGSGKTGNGKDSEPPIDISFLEDVFGDDQETITEILKEFVEPSRECCEEVEAGLEEKAYDKVSAGAHKLKSSARSIGAGSVVTLCEQLEVAGKTKELGSIKSLAPQLSSELDEVIEYIEAL